MGFWVEYHVEKRVRGRGLKFWGRKSFFFLNEGGEEYQIAIDHVDPDSDMKMLRMRIPPFLKTDEINKKKG